MWFFIALNYGNSQKCTLAHTRRQRTITISPHANWFCHQDRFHFGTLELVCVRTCDGAHKTSTHIINFIPDFTQLVTSIFILVTVYKDFFTWRKLDQERQSISIACAINFILCWTNWLLICIWFEFRYVVQYVEKTQCQLTSNKLSNFLFSFCESNKIKTAV